MSSLGSPNPFFIAGKKAYEIERSLRFNDDDTAYLERNVTSSSNRKTHTFSAWIKRCEFGDYHLIYTQGDNAGNEQFYVFFNNNDQIEMQQYDYPTNQGQLKTTQKFRDPSAWYHIVMRVDTTNSTADDRFRIYVNGEQVTSFETRTNPSQNLDTWINDTTYNFRIGATGFNGMKMDGYMAEINFIDGQAYDPSYFGQTDALTGQWNPKKYTGSYGTNGFYLNFSDNSGTTATTLGKDSSGNGNNFTPNNFSVSAGIGYDSMADTPTNNFPTLSPFDKSSDIVLYNGNLRYSFASRPNVRTVRATFTLPSSGKYYWEFCNEQASSNPGRISMGVVDITVAGQAYNTNPNSNGYIQYSYGGGININGSSIGTAGSWYNTERAAIAVDCDTGKFWFGKVASGGTTTWYNSSTGTDGNPATGDNPTTTLTTPSNFMPFGGWNEGGSGSEFFSASINFGQQPFLGTEPTGYVKLSSANLPNPTILLPNKHFDTLLYTANGGTQNITGLNFNPDWVWGKSRSQAFYHDLYDTVRGDNLRVFSNDTNAEASGFLQFGVTGGFALSAGGNINDGTDSVVAWNWNAGETDGKTYTVKVVSDSGNKYRFDDFGTSAVTLDLAEGGTYVFDWSDSSAQSHPIRFSTTSDGTHGGGSEYTTGVTKDDSAYKTTITVAASAPTLYYYCQNHSGMGGQVNTNSTLGSSNFDGNLQSVTKVNATAGFSIVKWTSGANAYKTVGHGLGVKPDIVIVKSRSVATGWFTFYDFVDGTNDYLQLNSTAGSLDAESYSIVPPTSTVFGTDGAFISGNTNATMIAYVFSSVAGYSKFGSYTGNGSNDGTFIYTGFRPAFVLLKSSNLNVGWYLLDNKRDPDNFVSRYLRADSTADEDNDEFVDFLANGFKQRYSDTAGNGSGDSYIYLAFAESPFKNARAR